MSDTTANNRFEELTDNDDILYRLRQMKEDIDRLQRGYGSLGEGVGNQLHSAAGDIERAIKLRERVIALQALSEIDAIDE